MFKILGGWMLFQIPFICVSSWFASIHLITIALIIMYSSSWLYLALLSKLLRKE